MKKIIYLLLVSILTIFNLNATNYVFKIERATNKGTSVKIHIKTYSF